ncbi:MAG: DUF1737 domain-containing protein [Kordiimonadaceae bacterium]|nr:DUF1737 domain-containing protein [Kordiimonadaceae bacterium]
MEYNVIEAGSVDKLRERVNLSIQDGWRLAGGVSASTLSGRDYFCQAVWKPQHGKF